MNLRRLASLPARDAASRHLLSHSGGSPLYPGGHLDSMQAVERRARKLADWDGDRAALAAWLREQNSFVPLHPSQEEHLTAATRPDAVFLMTGQQPGLLGGPALVFHKAATAAMRARALSAHLGSPVIPVFWAAGDDSDLAESNAAEFLEPGVSPGTVSLEFPDPGDAIPMSLRTLDPETARVLRAVLPAGWPGEVRMLAHECYAPGRSLTQAFLQLAQRMLGGMGVLFVDGFDGARRPAAQAMLRRIARDAAGFNTALERGTRRLRETLNLSPQVPVRPGTVPAFLLEKEARSRLFASDSGRVYTAGSEDRDLAPDLDRHVLLHSALSRPLVVESLFPVLGHVLGPAELRYFAQIADVFPAYGCSFPVLAPRAQATVVPATGLRRLEAMGFTAPDLHDLSPSRVRARLTEDAWNGHAAAHDFPGQDFARFKKALAGYQMRHFPGAGFDPALRRFDRAFAHYREQARRRVYEIAAAGSYAELRPLLRWLGSGAQDRHLNLLSLRAAVGAEGLALLAGQPPETGDTGAVYVADEPQGGA